MAVISLQNVTVQFGTQIVLHEVSFVLNAGETVGIVGANGSGKTTLLKLLSGEVGADTGQIVSPRHDSIGVLPQEPDLRSDRSLHDEVGSVFDGLLALEDKLHSLSEAMSSCADPSKLQDLMARYDRTNEQFIADGGHTFETRLHEIVGGLGFLPADYSRPVGILSGGQKCRVSLAKLLLQEKQILLLDEPTNHLDIDAARWLEKFLKDHRGEVVLISHDRLLLDALCDRIVEVERCQLTSYPGDYSRYAQTKQLNLLSQERQLEKDTAFIKKERAFITKHIAGQRTKEAQGRRTRLERRLRAGEFETERVKTQRTTKLKLVQAATSSETAIRCEALSMRFGDLRLFEDLSFLIEPCSRLGITGPNGTGKTTLLKILLGLQVPSGGQVSLDPKMRVAYYAQEAQLEDPDRCALDELRIAHPTLSEQEARNHLAGYLFRGDAVLKPLKVLSGGEQSRIRLAKLILESPDVLILDEPTNHLDIPSREVLESALMEFSGTIVIVSHDRYLLDRIVDKLLVMRPESCQLYDGNYSYYVSEFERVQSEARQRSRTLKAGREGKSAPKKCSSKKKTGPSPYDRMSIHELEDLVVQYETRLAQLQEQFGDPLICKNPDALAELTEEVEAVESTLSEVDREWQERAEYQ